MALIPVYHVVADMFPVDPTWDDDTNPIVSGKLVKLDSDGYVQPLTVAGNRCIGIAGDNLASTGPNTPYARSLVIGANGAQQASTQNRVSDGFNESLASGLMTVYRSGGRFLTDQYNNAQAYVIGNPLYSTNAGKITSVSAGSAFVVAILATNPGEFPSGVPGTDVAQSISLGVYVDILLQV
jgi:hypothetical protein